MIAERILLFCYLTSSLATHTHTRTHTLPPAFDYSSTPDDVTPIIALQARAGITTTSTTYNIIIACVSPCATSCPARCFFCPYRTSWTDADRGWRCRPRLGFWDRPPHMPHPRQRRWVCCGPSFQRPSGRGRPWRGRRNMGGAPSTGAASAVGGGLPIGGGVCCSNSLCRVDDSLIASMTVWASVASLL